MQWYLNHSGWEYKEVKREWKIIQDPCHLTRETNCYSIDFTPTGNTDQVLWLYASV
jgi:hypothetical protein